MRLRHILEYEDHEIQDLLGDLETIGQSTKRTYCLWVEISSFTYYTGYSKKLRLPVALGLPFWSKGNLLADQGIILDSLAKGNFTRPAVPELDWTSLTAVGIDLGDESNRNRLRSIEAVDFLDKPSLQTFFEEQEGKSLGQALDSLWEKILKIRYGVEDRGDLPRGGAGVALIYGEEEDPDLLIAPDASLYHATAHTERVVLEDLTNVGTPLIYLRDL